MIAVRTTWRIKPNCMEKALAMLSGKALEMLSGGRELGGLAVRVYSPRFSPNYLVFEMTSESLEERDKWWAEFNATPEAAAAYEKWDELHEGWVSREVWNVTEFR